MAFDDRLTPGERARLRRARRRAGLKPKPVRDTRTVGTVRAETAVREKAKRDFPTKREFPTPQSLASPAGIARLRQLTQSSAAAGRNDYGRGSIASPRPYPSRTSAELKGGQGPGTVGRLVKAFVKQPLEDAIWAIENPVDRITGKGRAANGQMMWPGAGRVGGGWLGGRSDPLVQMPGKTRVPKPPTRKSKSRDLADRIDAPEPRMSVYGEFSAQFPNAPSRITQKAQRGKDRLFEKTGGVADALRDSDRIAARAAGKAITPFSARGAVPKQAGKLRANERRRAQALRAEEIRTIRKVGRVLPGLRTQPAQAAHSLLAELPAAYREGTKGYELIKTARLGDLDEYVSGRYAKRLDEADASVRATIANAEDATEKFKGIAELEKLRLYRADIPARIKDLTTMLRKVDRLIAHPPKINHGVVEALDTIGRESEDIYVAAGVMIRETAEARRGLKSRSLGLEPTGEEMFIPDRMAKGRVPRRTAGGSIGLGKTRLPEGVATQNTGHLMRTGRLRLDLGAPIEAWQNAQKYQFSTEVKNDLAHLGKQYPGYVPEGYALLNPKGHLVSRRIHADDASQAAMEGFDEQIVNGDLAEYASNYLAIDGDTIPLLLAKAEAAGHAPDLRIIPVDVVKRYMAQFVPTKIQAATGGIKEASRLTGKTADVINDLVYLSLIYANPGYVPAAAAANLALTAAQQGAFLLPNIARAGQLLVSGPQRVKDLVRAEVGSGATMALASDAQTIVRKPAEIVGDLGDLPWRVSSLLHEAARFNVIDPNKPYLSAKDYKNIEEFMTNPKYRAALNDASDAANQAVIDFHRLGSKERAFAKRGLFVWGFTRGAVRYPGRFALDHPIRAAAGSAALYFGQDYIRDATIDDLPSRMRGSIKAGETVVAGKPFPKILQTRSYEPSSPPAELFGTLTGDRDARTFFGMAHPLVQAGLRVADRKDSFGYAADSYGESAKGNVKGLFPWYERAKDYIDPKADPDPLYPEDTSRGGRLKRDLRVFPVAIDPEVGAEKRRRELSRQGRAAPKTLPERRAEMVREELANARKLGLNDLTPEVRAAVNRKAAIETHTDALREQQSKRKNVQVPEGKRFKLTARQKAAAALMALRQTMPPSEFDYAYAKAHLDSLQNARDVESYLDEIRRDAYNTVLEDWHRHVNAAG